MCFLNVGRFYCFEIHNDANRQNVTESRDFDKRDDDGAPDPTLSKCNYRCCYDTLTVEPVGIVFQRSLERELLTSRGQVEQVRAEDDRVRFGELGVGAAVQGRQLSRVALLRPDGRRIVQRVVRTFGRAETHAGHVLVSGQVRQVGLREKKKSQTNKTGKQTQIRRCRTSGNTHVDHVVFWVVRVRAANVYSAPVADGLDDSDVVPAVEIL